MNQSRLRLIMGWVLISLGLLNVFMLVMGLLYEQTFADLSVIGFMAGLCFAFGIPIVYFEIRRLKNKK